MDKLRQFINFLNDAYGHLAAYYRTMDEIRIKSKTPFYIWPVILLHLYRAFTCLIIMLPNGWLTIRVRAVLLDQTLLLQVPATINLIYCLLMIMVAKFFHFGYCHLPYSSTIYIAYNQYLKGRQPNLIIDKKNRKANLANNINKIQSNTSIITTSNITVQQRTKHPVTNSNSPIPIYLGRTDRIFKFLTIVTNYAFFGVFFVCLLLEINIMMSVGRLKQTYDLIFSWLELLVIQLNAIVYFLQLYYTAFITLILSQITFFNVFIMIRQFRWINNLWKHLAYPSFDSNGYPLSGQITIPSLKRIHVRCLVHLFRFDQLFCNIILLLIGTNCPTNAVFTMMIVLKKIPDTFIGMTVCFMAAQMLALLAIQLTLSVIPTVVTELEKKTEFEKIPR